MKINFVKLKLRILIVGCSGLLLFFQNCGKSVFSSLDLSSIAKMENGTPYDGKPTDKYFRFLPEFTCEGIPTSNSILSMTTDGATLVENKSLKCAASERTLELGSIDFSAYQSEVVGFEEGIYEWKSESPAAVPANLVEVWCNESNDKSVISDEAVAGSSGSSSQLNGLEVMTHYDREKLLGVNRMYYRAGATAKAVADFPVSRLVSEKSVLVSSGNSFRLEVHRDQPSSKRGLFVSDLIALLDGTLVRKQIDCRIGGLLDPKIWPAKEVIDLKIDDLQISPDGKSYAYKTSAYNSVSQLVTGVFDVSSLDAPLNGGTTTALSGGFVQSLVRPLAVAKGVEAFSFSGDSTQVIYNADISGAYLSEIFKFNLKGQTLQRGSDPLINQNQSVSPDFLVLKDGSAVIYKDGSHDATTDDVEPWLRSLPLVPGSGSKVISQKFPLMDQGVYDFKVSTTLHRVVYLGGSTSRPDLYSVSVDGADTRKITPKFSDSSANINWALPFEVSTGETFAYMVAHGRRGVETISAVSIDGTTSHELPAGFNPGVSDRRDHYVLLNAKAVATTLQTIKVMNLQTGATADLGTLSSGSFSQDSQRLLGLREAGAGQVEPVIVRLSDRVENKLCPGAIGDRMKIVESSENEFIVVSLNFQTHTVDLFKKAGAFACQKLNSAVISDQKLTEIVSMTLSADQKKALVILGSLAPLDPSWPTSVIPQTLAQLAVYVPLNGKASLAINSRSFPEATLQQARFIDGTRKIFFVGEQRRAKESTGFIWEAPE